MWDVRNVGCGRWDICKDVGCWLTKCSLWQFLLHRQSSIFSLLGNVLKEILEFSFLQNCRQWFLFWINLVRKDSGYVRVISQFVYLMLYHSIDLCLNFHKTSISFWWMCEPAVRSFSVNSKNTYAQLCSCLYPVPVQKRAFLNALSISFRVIFCQQHYSFRLGFFNWVKRHFSWS